MRHTILYFAVAVLTLLGTGVVVFACALDLDWLDAVHFTLTAAGWGDLSASGAPASVKVFGTLLMIGGAASVAVLFAFITDYVLRLNLDEIFGRRRRRMKDHIVLCGLGNVGMRILESLQRMGEKVIVIEIRQDAPYLMRARQMKVPVIAGDVRMQAMLEEAHIADAKCLIAATNDDLANLEAALTVRTQHPNVRIVLRMFDQKLANKIRDGFGIRTAFSTSTLAAPAFAMAALDPAVKGSFYVGDDLLLNVELTVAPAARMAGMTTIELMDEGRYAILAHQAAATGQRQLNPSDPITLAEKDVLVVATPREDLAHLHELNGTEADVADVEEE